MIGFVQLCTSHYVKQKKDSMAYVNYTVICSYYRNALKKSIWGLELNDTAVVGLPCSSLSNFIQVKHNSPNEIIFNNDYDIAGLDALFWEGKYLVTLGVSVLKVMGGAPVISKLNLHIWVTTPSDIQTSFPEGQMSLCSCHVAQENPKARY